LITAPTRDLRSFNFQCFPLRKKFPANRDGIVIAEFFYMEWICQHCGAPFLDSAYRVKSEDSGVILLDIIVCQHCYVEARELGVHTEKIVVRSSSAPENTAARKKTGFSMTESDANRGTDT